MTVRIYINSDIVFLEFIGNLVKAEDRVEEKGKERIIYMKFLIIDWIC